MMLIPLSDGDVVVTDPKARGGHLGYKAIGAAATMAVPAQGRDGAGQGKADGHGKSGAGHGVSPEAATTPFRLAEGAFRPLLNDDLRGHPGAVSARSAKDKNRLPRRDRPDHAAVCPSKAVASRELRREELLAAAASPSAPPLNQFRLPSPT